MSAEKDSAQWNEFLRWFETLKAWCKYSEKCDPNYVEAVDKIDQKIEQIKKDVGGEAVREIKFRAWSIRCKMMHHLEPSNSTLSDLIEEKDWKVMELTGLRDKNGKEIWEGDIVRWRHPELDPFESPLSRRSRVGFHNTVFCLIDQSGTPERYTKDGFKNEWFSMEQFVYNKDCIEVLGNIYENPELLK